MTPHITMQLGESTFSRGLPSGRASGYEIAFIEAMMETMRLGGCTFKEKLKQIKQEALEEGLMKDFINAASRLTPYELYLFVRKVAKAGFLSPSEKAQFSALATEMYAFAKKNDNGDINWAEQYLVMIAFSKTAAAKAIESNPHFSLHDLEKYPADRALFYKTLEKYGFFPDTITHIISEMQYNSNGDNNLPWILANPDWPGWTRLSMYEHGFLTELNVEKKKLAIGAMPEKSAAQMAIKRVLNVFNKLKAIQSGFLECIKALNQVAESNS
ncbi:MAG: hypothetical protein SP1CHLAM54_17550 [Chlamydiia bacterium]|nr:hypothetical protein [Chlamydiia bacterium]MCH9616643.1 hypothetical protein [Chlamydiia bacterium]MCH9629374.1 hypothetical protein [Chlamydiia bacterium]